MPNGYLPWPYAAKAIVQHEWSATIVWIWVTFRFAMDTTVKPPDALWIPTLDGIPKTVSISAWQDPWTMLLQIYMIYVKPTRVLLEYDGPHKDLHITWDKQWEPWGPILSLDITT